MDHITRKNKRIYISTNLKDMTDKQLNNICELIGDITEEKIDKLSNRRKFVKYIEDNLKNMDDGDITKIKDVVATYMIVEETDEDKMKRVTLEIINKMLRVLKEKEIENLENFPTIRRDDILCDECKNVMEENYDYIFKNGFNKTECMVYQKKVKNVHFSILRAMLKKIGYHLRPLHKSTRNNGEKIQYTAYDIVKI
jgi:hypothetical protein